MTKNKNGKNDEKNMKKTSTGKITKSKKKNEREIQKSNINYSNVLGALRGAKDAPPSPKKKTENVRADTLH